MGSHKLPLWMFLMLTYIIRFYREPQKLILLLSTRAAAWQNQQNDLCAQQRLRSARASAQSDQSLRCALYGYLRTQGFFMQTAKTLIRLGGFWGWSEADLSLFLGRSGHIVGFDMRQLKLRSAWSVSIPIDIFTSSFSCDSKWEKCVEGPHRVSYAMFLFSQRKTTGVLVSLNSLPFR